MMEKAPELMAPAGNMEALKAALNSGADAVYLGGKAFNARGYAANFDLDELAEAIEFAHVRGARVYLTFNTLLADSELNDAALYLAQVYNLGVDAIIIQDMGLAYLARRCVPKLPLLASTQMSVHNVGGAKLLAELGFSRVVLARELDLKAIEKIKRESGLEVEVFIHGALCISYSGQCLMSSLIGGRSGNRGRCAQPCRWEYTLTDNKGKAYCDPERIGRYLLSARDLSTIHDLPALVEAGVDSFKIEGRAKRPEYVATVVRIYRRALDLYREHGKERYGVSASMEHDLAQVFNRGFTRGYLYGCPGRNLMGYERSSNRGVFLGQTIGSHGRRAKVHLKASLAIGDGIEVSLERGRCIGTEVRRLYIMGQPARAAGPGQVVEIDLPESVKPGARVFKTSDTRLLAQARAAYQETNSGQIVPVTLEATLKVGEPVVVVIRDSEGNEGCAVGTERAQMARKHPLTHEVVAEQLLRLGNTPYRVEQLDIRLSSDTMVPFSELNTLRRKAVERLTKARLAPYERKEISVRVCAPNKFLVGRDQNKPQGLRIAVSVNSVLKARAALEAGADVVYLGGETYYGARPVSPADLVRVAEMARKAGREVTASSPRITSDGELRQIEAFFAAAMELGLPVQVRNLGTLRLAQDLKVPTLYIDYPLYSFNTLALVRWEELGAKRLTLSPELNRTGIERLLTGRAELEYVVQGQLEMMVSGYCLPGAVLGGASNQSACTQVCRGGDEFYLSDRKGVRFPLGCDQSCRMHIFNAMDLCLLADLTSLQRAGIALVRIEARNRSLEYVRQVVEAYRRAITQPLSREAAEVEMAALASLTPAGLTRGHFYRGVV
jgi:putative protease